MKGRRKPQRREPALSPPSPQAFAALGPYARTRHTVHALGLSLPLDVPGDVFSTQRIDEGTQLLLGHLPAAPPQDVLEVGCGYGALGLPVAARFPDARALLLDRDLLAVAACAHNARQLGLHNARVVPGLGYRDLPAGSSYDWILCNVPARIGAAFVGQVMAAGQALLRPGGELRIVVIRDLERVVEEQGRARGLHALARAAQGPRHSVYVLPATPEVAPLPEGAGSLDDEALYARDQVELQAAPGAVLRLLRPHDASEDPQHAQGLAVLLDALPRSGPRTALAFRCGYGALPLALRTRYPQARVVAQERDLLDAAFARLNARALGLHGPLFDVVEALWPAEAARDALFDLVVGELSASAGDKVAAQELRQAAACLAPGGQALVLATSRQEREWLPGALPPRASAAVLVRRGGFSVLRLARPAAP